VKDGRKNMEISVELKRGLKENENKVDVRGRIG
jgi:hypothetical protein